MTEPYHILRSGFLYFEKWNSEDEPVFTSSEEKAVRYFNLVAAKNVKAAIYSYCRSKGIDFQLTIQTVNK